MSQERRVALVTGGGRGIGRAVCLELARQGMCVAVNYGHGEQAARETAELCRQLGVPAMTVQADAADPAACGRMVAAVMEEWGRVDVLVCNAGVTRDQLMLRMKEEEYDQVLNVNLKGAFFAMQAVTRPMMKQRFGRIVAISSVVGLHGNAGQCNYAASKAGLIGLAKSLARELAGRGVTVNVVAPGFIETDMTAVLPEQARQALLAGVPVGRPGQGEDVARAVAFFAGEESGYITGQVLCVDGGMAM